MTKQWVSLTALILLATDVGCSTSAGKGAGGSIGSGGSGETAGSIGTAGSSSAGGSIGTGGSSAAGGSIGRGGSGGVGGTKGGNGGAVGGALAIKGMPNTSAVAGVRYSFVPTASGGSPPLTFSITGMPAWAMFDPATGALTGTPGAANLGTTSAITISVTDGKATASLPAFVITVANSLDTGLVPAVSACSGAMQGTHATFDVGTGKTYPDLSTVPWLKLQAGDVVNIYYRAEPYRTNIAIKAQGTSANPVIINGVTDASCNRPIISGENATNAADQASGFHDQYSKDLGIILIWWGSGNYGNKPKFITIQNLEILNAPMDVAGIYAVIVEDFLVQNCQIRDNKGWGIFVNTKNEDEPDTSYRVTVRGSRLYNNGIENSYYYHNLYIQSYRALYEGNYIGQLRPTAEGSSLKDRSSGTVIRYNHIVASARAIDLVETEEGYSTVGKDPLYNEAWVYGNVIVNDDSDPNLVASGSLIHWGYDNTLSQARKGTLHFYNNTILSNYSSERSISIFDMESSTVEKSANNTVELQNNIIHQTGSAALKLAGSFGTVNLIGTNWFSTGWGNGDSTSVVVNKTGTVLTGTNPGVDAKTFHLTAGSPAIGTAMGTTPTPVVYQFQSPLGVTARATALDLGAFEH